MRQSKNGGLLRSGDDIPLRLMFTFLLIASPLVSLLTSCSEHAANTRNNHNTNWDGGSPEDDASTTVVDPLQNLVGHWVAELQSGAGTVWGQAFINADTWFGKLTFRFRMDDGTKPYLVAELHDDGSLSGEWLEDEFDMLNDLPNWQGTVSADQATVTSSTTDGRTVLLYRANYWDRSITGVWQRETDGRPLIFWATDTYQRYAALILDASNGWDDGEHFSGDIYTNDPRILTRDTVVGLLFAQGSRMHLQRPRLGAVESSDLFARAPTQSDLNGLWLGRERKSEGRVPIYSHVTVVVLDDVAHVRNWQGIVLHAGFDGQNWRDDHNGWMGHLSPDNGALYGEYEGYGGWYYSLERIIAPPIGFLSGEASSVSIDWANHQDPLTDPEVLVGTAMIVQYGTTLQISDVYSDGSEYAIEADLVGDRYEGVWWNVNDPATTSPWSGALNASGTYLVGRWVNGEYSFSLLPILSDPSEIPDASENIALFSLDPFAREALAYQHPEGSTLTVLRAQDRLSGLEVVTPSDEQWKVQVDQRLRPVLIEHTSGYPRIGLEWSSDAAFVTYSFDDGTNPTITGTNSIDLSDSALIDKLDNPDPWDPTTSESRTQLKQWILDHPGEIQATFRGELPVPSILGGVIATSFLKVRDELGRANRPAFDAMVTSLTITAAGIKALSTVLVGLGVIVAGGPVAVALVTIAAGMVIMTGVAILYKNLLTWLFGFYCEPCGLFCFVNCR